MSLSKYTKAFSYNLKLAFPIIFSAKEEMVRNIIAKIIWEAMQKFFNTKETQLDQKVKENSAN